MRVFLLTSVPLVPPWDQGDKNLAYLMTKALPHVDFTILTTPSLSESLGSNLEYVPIFRNSNSILMQKANVYSWFMFQSLFRSHRLRNLRSVGVKIHLPLAASTKPDVYHFIYKPNRFSSLLVKRLQEFKRHPVLHTVGAREVVNAMAEELEQSGRTDIRLTTSGCIGVCEHEPVMTVEVLGAQPVLYERLDAPKSREVFRQTLAGKSASAYVVYVGSEPSDIRIPGEGQKS